MAETFLLQRPIMVRAVVVEVRQLGQQERVQQEEMVEQEAILIQLGLLQLQRV